MNFTKSLVPSVPSLEFLPCLQTLRLSREASRVIFESNILRWLFFRAKTKLWCRIPGLYPSGLTSPNSELPPNHLGCPAISTSSTKGFLLPFLCVHSALLHPLSIWLCVAFIQQCPQLLEWGSLSFIHEPPGLNTMTPRSDTLLAQLQDCWLLQQVFTQWSHFPPGHQMSIPDLKLLSGSPFHQGGWTLGLSSWVSGNMESKGNLLQSLETTDDSWPVLIEKVPVGLPFAGHPGKCFLNLKDLGPRLSCLCRRRELAKGDEWLQWTTCQGSQFQILS